RRRSPRRAADSGCGPCSRSRSPARVSWRRTRIAARSADPRRGPRARAGAPGAGQLAAHQDRGAVYLAVELYTLARVLQLNHDGNAAGGRFRDLAFDVARRGFTAVRRDTVFEYYEMM